MLFFSIISAESRYRAPLATLARRASPPAPLAAQPTLQESAPFYGADSWNHFVMTTIDIPANELERLKSMPGRSTAS